MIDTGTSTWVVSHLKGAAKLAAEDAETSERLSRQIRAYKTSERDDCACGCGKLLPPGFSGDMLIGCRKRLWTRQDRAAKANERIAERAKSIEATTCACCGVQTRKYSRWGNVNKFCEDCRRKPLRWRRAQVGVTP